MRNKWLIAFRNISGIVSIIFFGGYVVIAVRDFMIAQQGLSGAGLSTGVDFAIMYAASKLCLIGQSYNVYDIAVHHEMLEMVLGYSKQQLLAWFYPPIFLLIVYPLALIPYDLSIILWFILTLSLLGYAIWKITANKTMVAIALGFPGIFMNLLWGQNAFFYTFLLGTGFAVLESSPLITGMLFGMLWFKPQFAIIPYIALVGGRYWKALLWSICFSCLYVLASLVVFGPGVWTAYLEGINLAGQTILGDWVNVNAIQPTVYSGVRLVTSSHGLSMAVQGTVSIIIVLINLVIWSKSIGDFTMRYCISVLSIFLFAPYVMQYDLAMLAIPLVCYAWNANTNGWLKGEFPVLVLLWLFAIAMLAVGEHHEGADCSYSSNVSACDGFTQDV
ncbi:MAG: glycosyltransferase family 87 protein [Syntrophomonadaceae bacterium]